MGYYSEVTYVAIGKKDDMLTAIAAWRLSNPDQAAIQLDEVYIVPHGDEHLLVSFYADSIKWYDRFDAIRAHTQFLASLEDKPITARFVRIGEDIDDIEVRDYGYGCEDFPNLYGWVGPVRTISVDFNIDPNQDIRKKTKAEPCQSTAPCTTNT